MENSTTYAEAALDTTQNGAAENTDNASSHFDTTQSGGEEPFVTVKYNHNKTNYSLKEAAKIIQKNMHYDSSIKKLQFLANSKGQKLPEFVNEIFEAAETKEFERLQEEFAEDEEGLNAALTKRKENFERAFLDMLENEEKKPSLNQRLADEYFELLEYFPNIQSIEEIPDEVLKQSAKNNKSLVLSYAIFKAKEQEKLLQNAEQQQKNSLTSAPPLSSPTVAGEDPTILAMLKGIRK